MIIETIQSPVNSGYVVSLIYTENNKGKIELPSNKLSKEFSFNESGKSLSSIIQNAKSDLFLKELWPDEFNFDFDMSIDAWRDLVITERRSPFETDGLSKSEAEWAWILINEWEQNPAESKSDFMEMLWNSRNTLEALGYQLYLSEESQNKLIELFSVYEPLTLQYKPSMDIIKFYTSIWEPLREKENKT